jgi:diguanylate cyclase (GGDEF)-like protein
MRNGLGEIIGAVETFSQDMGVTTVRQELRELRRSVLMDRLTGIGNRNFLEGRLYAAVAEVQHHPVISTGVLFMDIDNFKQFNDTYGHDVGDMALQMVASTLKMGMRKSDVIGRWGGEEFLAILYDVHSHGDLGSISEKLRMLVEFSRLDLSGSSQEVTMSVGATLLLPGDSPESVVRRADALLYQSKQAGRNRVSVG